MKPSEWLKVFLGFASESKGELPSLDLVRIHIGQFLIQRTGTLDAASSYRFEAHRNGPWSLELERDLNQLATTGRVKFDPASQTERPRLQATRRLRAEVEATLGARATTFQLALVEVVRGVLCDLPFSDLIDSINAEYPDFAARDSKPKPVRGQATALAPAISERVRSDQLAFWANTLIGARELARGEEFAVMGWPAR